MGSSHINPMMKKILLPICWMAITVFAATHTAGQTGAVPDSLFKLNGSVMAVNITTVTPTYVSFRLPGKPEEYTMERKEVHKLVYKNGRIEILNKAAFVMLDESSWEAVWMTEDKKEVGDLYVLGEIEARSPSSARSPSAAKKGAIIKLKKKAANMKGTLILVTKKETTGGYGEYPGYYIKGVAYGPEPPESGDTTETQGAEVKDAGM